jgi:hypothetical protein
MKILRFDEARIDSYYRFVVVIGVIFVLGGILLDCSEFTIEYKGAKLAIKQEYLHKHEKAIVAREMSAIENEQLKMTEEFRAIESAAIDAKVKQDSSFAEAAFQLKQKLIEEDWTAYSPMAASSTGYAVFLSHKNQMQEQKQKLERGDWENYKPLVVNPEEYYDFLNSKTQLEAEEDELRIEKERAANRACKAKCIFYTGLPMSIIAIVLWYVNLQRHLNAHVRRKLNSVNNVEEDA